MYYLPARGEPTALVSAVEPHVLDGLPGQKRVYRTWREYQSMLGEMVAGARRVAMEYVPENAIPYCSRVDAGTVELVREPGAGGGLLGGLRATLRGGADASAVGFAPGGGGGAAPREGRGAGLAEEPDRGGDGDHRVRRGERVCAADDERGAGDGWRLGAARGGQRQRGKSALRADGGGIGSRAAGRPAAAGLLGAAGGRGQRRGRLHLDVHGGRASAGAGRRALRRGAGRARRGDRAAEGAVRGG